MPYQEHLPQSVEEITHILLSAKRAKLTAAQLKADGTDIVSDLVSLEMSILDRWTSEYRSLYDRQKDPKLLDLMEHCYLKVDSAFVILSVESDANKKAVRYVKALNHLSLAYVYQEKGMPKIALQEAQRAVQLEPSLPGTHVALGEIYARQHRMDEASKELKTALAMAPNVLSLPYRNELAAKIASLMQQYHL